MKMKQWEHFQKKRSKLISRHFMDDDEILSIAKMDLLGLADSRGLAPSSFGTFCVFLGCQSFFASGNFILILPLILNFILILA